MKNNKWKEICSHKSFEVPLKLTTICENKLLGTTILTFFFYLECGDATGDIVMIGTECACSGLNAAEAR